MGILCAQVLALTGCKLTVVGHHSQKLALLAKRGIPTTLDDTALKASADLVIEATGHPQGYAAARRLVRPRGTVVLKSTYHGAVNADLTMAVVAEVQLIGSRCGPFEPALRLLKQSLVNVRPLIEARYPFSDVLKAFDHAAQPGALKVLVEI